jgi:hypothetical protein
MEKDRPPILLVYIPPGALLEISAPASRSGAMDWYSVDDSHCSTSALDGNSRMIIISGVHSHPNKGAILPLRTRYRP